jgi:hypothetical protein
MFNRGRRSRAGVLCVAIHTRIGKLFGPPSTKCGADPSPTPSFLGQRGLILRPVYDREKHSAFEHFLFEIGGVRFPFGSRSNAELGCYTLTVQCVVGGWGATHGLVHHGELSLVNA